MMPSGLLGMPIFPTLQSWKHVIFHEDQMGGIHSGASVIAFFKRSEFPILSLLSAQLEPPAHQHT